MGRKFANYRYDTDFGIKFYVLFPFEIILDFRGPAKSISDLSTVVHWHNVHQILADFSDTSCNCPRPGRGVYVHTFEWAELKVTRTKIFVTQTSP